MTEAEVKGVMPMAEQNPQSDPLHARSQPTLPRTHPTPFTYEVQELSEGYSAIIYDARGQCVGTGRRFDHMYEADAAFVVMACNTHAALADAIGDVLSDMMFNIRPSLSTWCKCRDAMQAIDPSCAPSSEPPPLRYNEMVQALRLIASNRGKTIFSYEPEAGVGANHAFEQCADIADAALAALEEGRKSEPATPTSHAPKEPEAPKFTEAEALAAADRILDLIDSTVLSSPSREMIAAAIGYTRTFDFSQPERRAHQRCEGE